MYGVKESRVRFLTGPFFLPTLFFFSSVFYFFFLFNIVYGTVIGIQIWLQLA